ncbi:protein kinase domain-containing protein [Roseimaritima sediminicola]|uniref:protein kinase domain-containing protein n=1 Tax=Roseimaritima sediminicola TaxID=2662066 RepID=UPI0012982472|nr:protein kinase [Roseimaritima sediminicola]
MEPDTHREKELQKAESLADQPDDWLLRRWKDGDEGAAAILYDRYAIRLVALVASRLNRRFRAEIDPGDVVQSALGSFFDAARHSRIRASQSVSLWRLLATFARRKLARSIERHAAAKRGGDRDRVSLGQLTADSQPSAIADGDAEELEDRLKQELAPDQFAVVQGLLAGQAQREIAASLGIDERTVRRRLSRIRELLAPSENTNEVVRDAAPARPSLPRVDYSRFVLGKLIGSGGFGKVYRARLQADARTVAVKFLRKTFWQHASAHASFLREIDAASRIRHPGVIRYLGYGESPHGGPYVLSEWIDGGPMHAIERPGRQRFAGWVRQICEALQAVHRAGLVHGDLTPANLLVDEHDRIVITDFGFSQAFSGSRPPVLGGTLGFAAPEQIDPALGSISPQTDIYAIGGLIHWYLFGHPPNAAPSIAASLAKTVASPSTPVPPKSASDANPQTIRSRSLHASPANRTISLEEIAELVG